MRIPAGFFSPGVRAVTRARGSGTGSRAELEETGATHIIQDVSQLPRLVFGPLRQSPAAQLAKMLRTSA